MNKKIIALTLSTREIRDIIQTLFKSGYDQCPDIRLKDGSTMKATTKKAQGLFNLADKIYNQAYDQRVRRK